jgi:CheY-like chemotaxis protein
MKKILIVDDDLESLKLIGLMLQRRGYEIVAAHTGNQALVKAGAENPDLVILDVMMPDMDGFQVCERLRSNPDTADLPVLMFTAKTLTQDRAAGFAAGADDYLTKPIHPAELASHVEALLRRSERDRARATPLSRARVIGVMGAKGGVGASTLAVNLAVAAGQQSAPGAGGVSYKRVGVVDMRVGGGTVALLLGQIPRAGWARLVRHSLQELDQETIESQMLGYGDRLRYLPAPIQPENGSPVLSPEHVNLVLKRLATATDYLFLDLGSVLDEPTRRAVAICDCILLVVEPEPLCLMLAQGLLEKIGTLEPAPAELSVVVIDRLGGPATYSREEVERLLGYELVAVIDPALTSLRQAIEQGKPVVLSHPESRIAQQLQDLCQRLLA